MVFVKSFLIITALCAQPVELHTVRGTAAGAHLRNCLTHDFPVVCEDTRAIEHFRCEIRRVIVFRDSLDDFVQVGRHKSRFPDYQHPAIVILVIKREIDMHNRRRVYAETTADHEISKQIGLLTLGSEEFTAPVIPQPWEAGYTLTAFRTGEP